jgi:hypothetical protein
MATWQLKKRNFLLGIRLQGTLRVGQTVEIWHGTDLVAGQPAGTSSIAVQDIIEHPDLPRVIGQEHGELPNCVCLDKKLIKGPWKNQALVAVIFGPPDQLAWGAAPRIYGKPSRQTVNLHVPVYRRVATDVQSNRPIYADMGWDILRGKAIRRRPHLVTQHPDTLANYLDMQVGKEYLFAGPTLPSGGNQGGIPYIFDGYSFFEVRQNLYCMYEFWTLTPVLGIASAGTSGPPTQVAVPALGYLENYEVDLTAANGVPTIRAVKPRYPKGDPLP